MEEQDIVDVCVPATEQGQFDLGKWIGRREAFGLVAGRCSAADVECIRRIRDDRLYKTRSDDWSGFCDNELHMSKSNANRLIALLEQFGPQYFHISQITRISPSAYRAIAPAVSAEGIECNGELIPFNQENSERIAAAVSALSQAERAKPEITFEDRLGALEAARDRLLDQFRELRRDYGASHPYLTSLAATLEERAHRLKQEIR